MEIAAGLHRIDGLRGANAYVTETDEGLMVVDTGMPGSAEKIRAMGYRILLPGHGAPVFAGRE